MANTLNSTFASFFSEPDYTKCLDCKTEDTTGYIILWTTKDGYHEWVCPKCHTERQAEGKRREQEEADKINFALNMY